MLYYCIPYVLQRVSRLWEWGRGFFCSCGIATDCAWPWQQRVVSKCYPPLGYMSYPKSRNHSILFKYIHTPYIYMFNIRVILIHPFSPNHTHTHTRAHSSLIKYHIRSTTPHQGTSFRPLFFVPVDAFIISNTFRLPFLLKVDPCAFLFMETQF